MQITFCMAWQVERSKDPIGVDGGAFCMAWQLECSEDTIGEGLSPARIQLEECGDPEYELAR